MDFGGEVMSIDDSDIQILWVKYNSRSAGAKTAESEMFLEKEIFEIVKNAIKERLGDSVTKCESWEQGFSANLLRKYGYEEMEGWECPLQGRTKVQNTT